MATIDKGGFLPKEKNTDRKEYSTDAIARVKRMQEVEANRPNAFGVKSVSGEVIPAGGITFDAAKSLAVENEIKARKSATFNAERQYIETGEWPKEKHSAELDGSKSEFYVEPVNPTQAQKAAYDELLENDKKRSEDLERKLKASKVKQPTAQDLAFAKAQAIFSAKPKEHSPEVKAAMIRMGYNPDK